MDGCPVDSRTSVNAEPDGDSLTAPDLAASKSTATGAVATNGAGCDGAQNSEPAESRGDSAVGSFGTDFSRSESVRGSGTARIGSS